MKSNPNTHCCVMAESDDRHVLARAAAAAKLLRTTPLFASDGPPDREGFVLLVQASGMTLYSPGESIRRGVTIDLASLIARYRRSGVSRLDPLARAVGSLCFVVDATAGFGDDAVMLSMLGYSVLALERSPIPAVMLQDALQAAKDDEGVLAALDDRLDVRRGDGRDLLPVIDPPPEVVVIDPMFPPKRRASALPRKQLQILREIVGDDDDACELFDAAVQAATRRVVVKRSDDGPPLRDGVSMQYRSKLVRYDVYVLT